MASPNRVYQRYSQYYSYILPILADPVVKTYFGLIASIILVTFLSIFALSPTINIILGLQKKIADQNDLVTRLDKKTADLVAAQQTFGEVEDSLPLLNLAIPVEPTPEGVISSLHRTASEAGVQISGLQFRTIYLTGKNPKSNPTLGAKSQLVEFTLAADGAQMAVRDFLGQLENQLRYIRVNALSMAFKERSTLVSAQVEGRSYFLPEDNNAAK